MEKQEFLKCITQYLPYGFQAQVKINGKTQIMTVMYYHVWEYIKKPIEAKPILRPISDLFKYPEMFEAVLDEFSEYELESLRNSYIDFKCNNKFDHISYSSVMTLIKNHFDIFDLIELGLAVNVNDLNK